MPAQIVGAENALKCLAKFSPDLAQSTNQRLNAAFRPIVAKSRGYMPATATLSGWQDRGQSSAGQKYRRFPLYNGLKAKFGIDYEVAPTEPNRKGWITLAKLYNRDPAGAIYETAGRKNPRGQKHQSFTKGKYSSYIDTSNKVSKSLNPNAGLQFIQSMPPLVNAFPRAAGQRGRSSRKGKGRAIYRAWSEDQGKANAAILTAIDDATKEFYSRLRKKVA